MERSDQSFHYTLSEEGTAKRGRRAREGSKVKEMKEGWREAGREGGGGKRGEKERERKDG